ncbi:MAG: hypothetical protein ABDH28_01885 [Brevinematia bacterium]
MDIEKYIAMAGYPVEKEKVIKVLLANNIPQEKWTEILEEVTKEYLDKKLIGEKVFYLDMLAQRCFVYKKKTMPSTQTPMLPKKPRPIPEKISSKMKELGIKEAILFDKNTKSIYISGNINNKLPLYVLEGETIKLVNENVRMVEVIQFIISLL